MKHIELKVELDAIYAEKWRYIAAQICAKHGGSVLMAQGQFLTREVIDGLILRPVPKKSK